MSRTPCHRLALVALLSLLSLSGVWRQPPKAARAKPQFKPPVIPENVVFQLRDVPYGEVGATLCCWTSSGQGAHTNRTQPEMSLLHFRKASSSP